jgi:hypothetical protein
MFSTQSKFALSVTAISLVAAAPVVKPAIAQVVVLPSGNYENDFEKYLVATIAFVLLCFAVWRFFKGRR